MLVVAAALLAAGIVIPPGTAAPFRVASPQIALPLLDGKTEVEERETWATYLASHDQWSEWGILVEGTSVGGLYGDMWTLTWPWLADWVTEQYRKELTEAGGAALTEYENVWLAREPIEHRDFPPGSTLDHWLIRRGDTILWVESNLGPLDRTWLEQVLAELEGGGRT